MKRDLQASRIIGRTRPRNRATALFVACLGVAALGAPHSAAAGPFIWDQDTDGMDDRIETVHLLGYSYSFENADTLAPQRFQVVRAAGTLSFGAYVVFDHAPTDSDLAALTLLGMPVLHRYEGVPAVRTFATFPQLQAAVALAGIERVEAVPLLYPQLHEAAAAIGARDPSEHVFPTWSGSGGADGTGVVVAILDTGVNDAVDGAYPGHEALIGRCLGGASYVQGDSLLDTPRDGSVNPVDHGGDATHAHGTHVAGIILGSGGASGYAVGIAPGARFVDVKVLGDTGSGIAVGDGLDWCIHNRARAWGPAGYAGIQVVNLSLSSPDASDGNDVVSQLADRAAELGMVVVASMGNGAQSSFVPSPAGGDRVLAVGAMDDQRSGAAGDDVWATFDNSGPRASDGDGDALDEQKPDLLAPGVAILSADGAVTSDGTRYQRLSGTSMAAAFVSGAAALLRSQDPSLTPGAIATLLRATARRGLAGAPAGSGGADPRWRSSTGFGVVDVYAARLELLQPERSQIEGLGLTTTPTTIEAELRTQRERGAAYFVFERAADVAGVPGAFTAMDSVAAAGDSSLSGVANRHVYPRSWSVPVNERGAGFWYRVAYTEGAVRYATTARRLASPVGPSVATVELTIVHDALDHDLTGSVWAGGPGATFAVPLPGTQSAVSSDVLAGESSTGTVAWTFHIEVPAGTAVAPAPGQPWRVRLDEAGYLNRSGRLTRFAVVWHGPGGDVTYEGGPVPLPTFEGQSVYAAVPNGTTDVGAPAAATFHFGPNPVRAGEVVAFALPGAAEGPLEIYDLAGRRVARADFASTGAGSAAQWRARDASGRALAPGVYLARLGGARSVRVVVLPP